MDEFTPQQQQRIWELFEEFMAGRMQVAVATSDLNVNQGKGGRNAWIAAATTDLNVNQGKGRGKGKGFVIYDDGHVAPDCDDEYAIQDALACLRSLAARFKHGIKVWPRVRGPDGHWLTSPVPEVEGWPAWKLLSDLNVDGRFDQHSPAALATAMTRDCRRGNPRWRMYSYNQEIMIEYRR